MDRNKVPLKPSVAEKRKQKKHLIITTIAVFIFFTVLFIFAFYKKDPDPYFWSILTISFSISTVAASIFFIILKFAIMPILEVAAPSTMIAYTAREILRKEDEEWEKKYGKK